MACSSASISFKLLPLPFEGEGRGEGVSKTARHVLSTIEWIPIPEGEFIMGSTPEEAEAAYKEAKLRSSMLEKHAFDPEIPQHRVFLEAYEISRHEITNAQYKKFVEDTRRPKPRGYEGEDTWSDETLNGDSQPVVGVTWFDAQAFAEWLGGSLPSEAQWERAARSTDARKYPWGNSAPNPEQANFARRYNQPTPVGQFPKGASVEGVEDLAGNIWEWCMDEFDATFYKRSPARNPIHLRRRDQLKDRVIRGGSWDYGLVFMRSALRFRFYPLNSTHNIGFRVARSISSASKPNFDKNKKM